MTLKEFTYAYCMGMYHQRQLIGHALTDIQFKDTVPQALDIEMAEQAFKKYKPTILMPKNKSSV